jgi:hypothetical protein
MPLGAALVPGQGLAVDLEGDRTLRPVPVAQGKGHHPGPDPFQDLDLALHRDPFAVAEVPDAVGVAGRDDPDLVPVFQPQPPGVWAAIST